MSDIGRCCAQVLLAGTWSQYGQCKRKAKVSAPNGNVYCASHDPERISLRRQAAIDKYKAARDTKHEEHRRLSRYDVVIRLLRDYESEWTNPVPDLTYRRQCREKLFTFLAEEPR